MIFKPKPVDGLSMPSKMSTMNFKSFGHRLIGFGLIASFFRQNKKKSVTGPLEAVSLKFKPMNGLIFSPKKVHLKLHVILTLFDPNPVSSDKFLTFFANLETLLLILHIISSILLQEKDAIKSPENFKKKYAKKENHKKRKKNWPN